MKTFHLKHLFSTMFMVTAVAPLAYADTVIASDPNDVKVIVNDDNGRQGDFIVQNKTQNSVETIRSGLGYTRLKTDQGNSLTLDNTGVSLADENGNGLSLTGVKNADLSHSSTDAVNGSQLYDTNNKVEKNTNQITQNTADIATNKADIASNKKLINQNTTNIQTNTNHIATNTTNISMNKTDIATNRTNIANNKTDIAANTTNISANKKDIATNTADITINKTNISTNAANIASNRTDILNLRSDVNHIYGTLKDQKSEYRSGIASIAAMANIPVVPGQTFSAGLGLGNFKNETAVAAGANWNVNQNVTTKLSFGIERSNVTVGTGVAFGF